MNILYEAIALEELADEDWKTQLARKYPDIPKDSIVNVLQEDYYNCYGGPWTRVEWNGNWYWVSSDKLKKLNFMPNEMQSMADMSVLVIGCGVVGSNVKSKLDKLSPDVVDKFKPYATSYDVHKHYGIAFVCVDTQMTDDSVCDCTEVKNAILENNASIFIVKSTVLPGTTDRLAAETGKRIVFSPEFYGSTQHCSNFDFDFTILGGDRADCIEVQQALQQVFDARHKFKFTDRKTAELCKYMENCYLAAKVTFCNEFFRIAEREGVCYEELRELVTLDPRVGASHTFVYRDHPYWQSHCFDKDVRAIAAHSGSSFLKAVVDTNEMHKKSKYASMDNGDIA